MVAPSELLTCTSAFRFPPSRVMVAAHPDGGFPPTVPTVRTFTKDPSVKGDPENSTSQAHDILNSAAALSERLMSYARTTAWSSSVPEVIGAPTVPGNGMVMTVTDELLLV